MLPGSVPPLEECVLGDTLGDNAITSRTVMAVQHQHGVLVKVLKAQGDIRIISPLLLSSATHHTAPSPPSHPPLTFSLHIIQEPSCHGDYHLHPCVLILP